MSRPLTIARDIFLIVLLALAIGAGVLYLIGPTIEGIVIPPPEIPRPDWIAGFQSALIYTFVSTTFFSLVWYALAGGVFSVIHWKDGDRRLWWLGIGILCVLVSGVVGSVALPEAQSGAELAYVLFFASSATVFYLTTVLFSPYSFKYTPLGARILRPKSLR